MFVLTIGGRWDVSLKNRWEVRGRIGKRWELNSQNWWEVGDWSHKQVGDRR